MGQVGSTHKLRSLLAQLHGVLQHLQFRTVLEGHLVARVLAVGRVGQHVLSLVGQRDVAVERQSAELAEQHLRQHNAVFHLSHLHVGFVHFYIYLQARSPRGYAFFDHLVNVVVQLLHQVAIAVGQLLLLLQRNHRPVYLVNVACRSLTDAFQLVGHELLVDVGHTVGCRDGPTHVDGLAQHHRSSEDVPRIGLEGIVDFLAHLVAQLCQWLAHLTHETTQLLGHLRRDEALLHESHQCCRHVLANTRHCRRAQIGEGRLLVFVQERNLAAEELVAAQHVHLWQVFRADSLPGVQGYLLLHASHPQLLVVVRRQLPTLVERQHPLRPSSQRGGQHE